MLKRNLVIVYTPGAQELSDWVAVKEKINAQAPDIDVRIVDNTKPDPAVGEWQQSRPSLVFSPCNLLGFAPASGKVYVGRNLSKTEERRRLTLAGIPMPRSVLLIPGLSLNPTVWGEYVLVKPLQEGGSLGRSIKLALAEKVGARYLELTLNGRLRMLVQELIDATDESGCIHAYRVLTMFGRPLYCLISRQLEPRPSWREIHASGSSIIAHNTEGVERERKPVDDADVLELAVRSAKAMCEFPVLGLDVIRERKTGDLFVLETNSGGNVWHLSSRTALKQSLEERRQKYNQFGALDIAASVLIERTRQEASWFSV